MKNKIKEFERKWRQGVLEDFETEEKTDEYDRGFKDGAIYILDLIKEEFALHAVRETGGKE